jgi:hypothetical protein
MTSQARGLSGMCQHFLSILSIERLASLLNYGILDTFSGFFPAFRPMWRVIIFLILAFWSCMTYLLLQRTYWAAGARHPVEVAGLLHTAALNSSQGDESMDLLHEGKKVGEAMVRLRPSPKATPGEEESFLLDSSGSLRHKPEGKAQTLTWQLAGHFQHPHDWLALSLRIRQVETDTTITLEWLREKGKPVFTVHRAGQLIMDMQSIEQQAASLTKIPGMSLDSMPALQQLSSIQAMQEAVQITAHTSAFRLAGELRQGHTLAVSLLGLYKMEVIFSKAGEIVRIDMPSDWHLLNPLLGTLGK